MAERRTFTHRAVFAGLVASLLLAAAAAVYIYYAYVQYDRVAARHLPAGTDAALRLDLEKVVLFEPVRRHVFPLVNARRQAAAPEPRGISRLERIQQATGVELAVDLREVALGFGPGPLDWVLVVGGRFPRSGFIEGLERVLREEGAAWQRSADGRALVSASTGIALGQADDGALLAAAREALLRAALPTTEVHRQLGLPLEGPGGYAVLGGRLQALVPGPMRALVKPLGVVDSVRRVRGELALGAEMTLTSWLELGDARAAATAEQLQSLRQGARTLGLLAGPQAGGMVGLAERLEVSVASPTVVEVTTRWTREEVDQGVAEATRLLQALFGWP